MKMKNKTYDALKFLVTVFAPALMTLVGGLGAAGLVADTDVIVTVIGLVTAFVGSLIGLSSKQYKSNKEG